MELSAPRQRAIDSNVLILGVATFVLVFCNFRFLINFTAVYPVATNSLLFSASVALLLLCVNTLLMALFCCSVTTKPALILFLLLSAFAAYFMDTYNVIIDDVMIDNILRTDHAEVSNLLSVRQVLYVLLLGILPSCFVLRTRITPVSIKRGFLRRLGLLAGSIAVIIAILFSFGDSYATFFRENKLLRYYSNPTYLLYSMALFAKDKSAVLTQGEIERIALDASINTAESRRKLIVIVVGEAARADHMSLNGYDRITNPLLGAEKVISYTNFWSCGTSTAVSVPCMFSPYTKSEYSASKVQSTENVLDVLDRLGMNVVWLDNNSDSKGVALRIPYHTAKTAGSNPVCDSECRDVGMVQILDDYVSDHPEGDIVIVMHQMGNHGPAYYRRYPAEFELFVPTCKTNILENCSQEEIINSYDNAILYTDYFLAKTIESLKGYGDQFSASFMYIGDHGESLGEYGLYLHGLPYAFAPDSQKHVPVIMWFNDSYRAEHSHHEEVSWAAKDRYSHDNVFHTILGLAGVSSNVYEPAMDILAP